MLRQHLHGRGQDLLRICGVGHRMANAVQYSQTLRHIHRGSGFGHRIQHADDRAMRVADRAVAKGEIRPLRLLAALNHQREVFDIRRFTGKCSVGDCADFTPGFFPDLIERSAQRLRLTPKNGHKSIVVEGD